MSKEWLKLLTLRHSCRSFKQEKLPKEIVDSILEYGRLAASAHGAEDTITLLLESSSSRAICEERASFFMGGFKHPFYNAPHVAAILSKKNDSLKCGAFDGALVLGNMMLAATAYRVGSCWINTAQYDTEFQPETNSALLELTDDLGLGRSWNGIGYLAFGWPSDPNFYVDFVRVPPQAGRIFEV